MIVLEKISTKKCDLRKQYEKSVKKVNSLISRDSQNAKIKISMHIFKYILSCLTTKKTMYTTLKQEILYSVEGIKKPICNNQ